MREAREQIFSRLVTAVRRAKDTGALRADIEPTDFPLILMMLATLIDATRDATRDAWRRFLPIVLDGLRAGSDRNPLPFPAIDEATVADCMEAFHTGKR